MAPPRRMPSAPSEAAPTVSVNEALNRLGMTQEQFQAKQAELLTVLLRNQPFVPQHTSTRFLPQFERSASDRTASTRSRSTSISSNSSRASSPAFPRTPVKPNHGDVLPPRPRDRMEFILEERNRLKAQRRGSTSRSGEDERVLSTPSRGTERAQPPVVPPETPHHYKYYSERVVGEASSSKKTLDNVDVLETPSRGRDRGRFKMPLPRYPKTPSKQVLYSSLPTTPRSSPPPIVNIVSSPPPMRPTPLEEDHLPFTLPPGPYSEVKPDLSYAAIIGRAILASPGHALALQDIYEYIVTVFPHYKRGEQTWMNSVRHALSTMAVFRKVQRGRAEGKSLWAIYDCDLPCFEGGGFKKALCADMNNGSSTRGSKKRCAEEGGGSKSKRKKTSDEQQSALPAPVLPPYFPQYTSNPHHQPYYQAACMQQQQVSADALFPPLPPSSNYHQVITRAASIPVLDTPSQNTDTDQEDEFVPSSPIERPPSSSSIPDLVSNLSSSSSPAPSSHLSLHDEYSREPSPSRSSMPPASMDLPSDDDTETAPELPGDGWLRSEHPLRASILAAIVALSTVEGRNKILQARTVEEVPQAIVSMAPPGSPTPHQRRIATGAKAPSVTNEHGSRLPAAFPLQPETPSASSPADVAEAVRVLQQTLNECPSESQSSLESTVIEDASESSESQERPRTPVRSVTPPPPSTPVRAGQPSTPSRLAQLESELFDFSPFRYNVDSHARLTPMAPTSPSLSIFNAAAPLLHTGNIDEFIAADPPAFTIRSPLGHPRTPRTPRKTPGSAAGSSLQSLRVPSPFGTPSRTMSREGWSDLDDDIARFFSPRLLPYEGMMASHFSGADAGSPSSSSLW